MGGVTREGWTRFVEAGQKAQAAIDDVVKAGGKGTALDRPHGLGPDGVGKVTPTWLDAPRPRTKYGNRATVRDGIRFHSRLEADRYTELKLLREDGAVLFFLRQVPFHLEAGVIWRADFVVFWRVPKVEFASFMALESPLVASVTIEDTKGVLTDAARIKIKQAEARYPIRVRILKRANVRRFADVNA